MYPLIILGAGASYDFLKIGRHDPGDQHNLSAWRPPLTNNIFDVSRFSGIIGKYEDVKPLASTIINIVDGNRPFDFEAYLSEQETQFPDKSYPQIIALRFYLAELFSKVTHNFYRHTNNHSHLIDQINKRAGRALVVNFNYDTLFEKNIKTIGLSNQIESYISGNIKVIKIHGAYNWRYSPEITTAKSDVYDFFVSGGQSLHEKYKNHDVYPITVPNEGDFNLNEYREYQETGFPGGSWRYYLPAIAIPIATKANSVCPPSHIKILTDVLPNIDRVLVVGWRAQDEYLLQLLKDNLNPNVKIVIVSKSNNEARKIKLKFQKALSINPKNITASGRDGYTDFMINRDCEKFLT